MTRHLTIRVFGHVQGVNFRQSAKAESRRLGVTGCVRNEPDGTLFVEVEGDRPAVERFADWCKHGPPSARVERVEVADGEVEGYASFTVR